MKPRLLDLFCGAGGAAVGYHRAGFEVVGVDIKPQPRYPFEFVRADALDWPLTLPFGYYDAIHASPPCQAFTTLSNRWRGADSVADAHDDLIAPTRELLEATGLPYVIENVMGASRLLRGRVVRICGSSVGIEQRRHRLFECGGWMALVSPCSCSGRDFKNVMGEKPDGRWLWRKADGSKASFVVSSVEEARDVMGIDWMEWRELCEAIPPAYTEFIGTQLIAHLKVLA